MNKQDIYNTLKTKQLHYAIQATVLATECVGLTGYDLESTKKSAKEANSVSNALLGAINDLLGNDYKGHKVMNTENTLLLDKWHDLETKRREAHKLGV